jgi:hypothetical protein
MWYVVHPLVLADLGKRTPFPSHLHNPNHVSVSASILPLLVLPRLVVVVFVAYLA